jgi:hypothetical protein
MPALAVLSVDCGRGPHAAVAAARFVAAGGCPRLRSLTLRGVRIDAPQLSLIADALTRPSVAAALTELTLTFVCTRDGADRLLGALGALAQLQTLDLRLLIASNVIDVASELVRTLGALKALKKLTLNIRAVLHTGMYGMRYAPVIKALNSSCTTLRLVVSGAPTREAATAAASAALATFGALAPARLPSVRTLTLIAASHIEHHWFDPAFFLRVMPELKALKIAGAMTAINVDARSLPDWRAQLPNLQVLGLKDVRLM